MTSEIRALVEHRFRQAEETLQAARELLGSGLHRDSVNRGYYAMFYAGLALLASRVVGTSKHSGLLSLFGKHFVKTGEFPAETGRYLRQAFELRQECDYEDLMEATPQQAEEIVAHAEAFLAEAKHLWERLQNSHP